MKEDVRRKMEDVKYHSRGSFWKQSSLQFWLTLGYPVGLKGHCHAIWQLYKKLEGVFASIEFQN